MLLEERGALMSLDSICGAERLVWREGKEGRRERPGGEKEKGGGGGERGKVCGERARGEGSGNGRGEEHKRVARQMGTRKGWEQRESGEKGTVRVESAKEGAEKATHHIHHQIIFTEYSTYVVAKQLRAQQLACSIACIRPTFLSCANSISAGNKRRKRGGGCGKGREW